MDSQRFAYYSRSELGPGDTTGVVLGGLMVLGSLGYIVGCVVGRFKRSNR